MIAGTGKSTRIRRPIPVAVGLLLMAAWAQTSAAQVARPLPRPDHVVVVIEERHSFSQIIGSPRAPFINALARRGALFTRSHHLDRQSLPNYLSLFSGSNQGYTRNACPSGPFETPNLGAALFDAGLSFAGYAEGLPGVGSTACRSGSYVRRHNPWVSWQGSPAHAIPAEANRPFASFPDDFRRLPTLSFVVPDLDHDMHNGSIRSGDEWLQWGLGRYVDWAMANNSLLILTFDEGAPLRESRVVTLFVGPMVVPGLYDEPITPFHLLRTLEDLYNLPHAGQSATAAPILDIWGATDPPGAVEAWPISRLNDP